MGIREAINTVNNSSGELAFIAGRQKQEIDALLGKQVTIEDLVIVNSKFDDGKENAVFTVVGDLKHFYRTGSATAVANFKTLIKGLEEDGLGWGALTVTIEQVKSKQGRRYYAVKAALTPEAEAKLAEREAQTLDIGEAGDIF